MIRYVILPHASYDDLVLLIKVTYAPRHIYIYIYIFLDIRDGKWLTKANTEEIFF